ncbi:pyrimidine 5'-nucleotidase [Ampullimonas aquatilis]|uniref:pyrimidine 5'-nucleotidase n=1 Tax=Ampullimonas aquatilis TaxID=1341549 RepID=UPI003C724693
MPVWLFDLDNTLHNTSYAIFPLINRSMTVYMQERLGLDELTANRLRQVYWQRYGATLLGLMQHHQVDPADFLQKTHDFDDVSALMAMERGLSRRLARLPGRKILLTNAPSHYANEIVRHLRIHRHFSEQIAIEQMWVHGKLRPKPSTSMLRQLFARLHLHPSQCVLVEDSLENLRAAKALGCQTVWITGFSPRAACMKRPRYVDRKYRSVKSLNRHSLTAR